jgi:hypothetical protein
MPEFSTVKLSDINWIRPIVCSENTKNADFSFTNIYAWGDFFQARACKIKECLVIRLIMNDMVGYSFPIGCNDEDSIKSIIAELQAYAKHRGEQFRLVSLTKDKLPFIERLFPGMFDVFPNTDLFDYVYSAEKLASLAGKKLHAKRNYINRFISEREWSYEPIDERNLNECMAVDGIWAVGKSGELDMVEGEMTAIKKSLADFHSMYLDGGLLRVSGKICAFTIGERLSRDTYVVHFEKALPDIIGAYQMINREFIRHIIKKYPDIVYINREDDMGLENLRKAKRSYYPEFMVEKYTAVYKQ